MSLNWKEIDQVLAELDLVGAQLQAVLQPAYDTLLLSMYKPGRPFNILICVAHGACRIHSTSRSIPKSAKPQRFMELLRSRIRGGRITAASQLGAERIIIIHFKREDTELDLKVRLWSGAANIILTKPDGTIIDALARKPARGEIAGGRYLPEQDTLTDRGQTADQMAVTQPGSLSGSQPGSLSGSQPGSLSASQPGSLPGSQPGSLPGSLSASQPSSQPGVQDDAVPGNPPDRSIRKPARPREFNIRELPGTGSFNQRLDDYYAEHGSELSRQALLDRATKWFDKRRNTIETRLSALERTAADNTDPDRFKELGDILMANQHCQPEQGCITADDFYRGGIIAIRLEPGSGILDSAKAYYEKARNARNNTAVIGAEIDELRANLARLQAERASIESELNPHRIREFLVKRRTAPAESTRTYPGLSMERNGWTILVGRSAAENDELLRRHIRGNDTWLHARDYAGSYVFIKNRPGKSIPLDVLIDAGTLALHYSKARNATAGDLYYTQAKYLRRVKNGPKGLVIPTQERNLRVQIDPLRLRELRRLIG
jgi:predicted ribosome quality control (RQC) complex YloA/Tae2 family protein